MKKFILMGMLALSVVSCSACGKKLPEPAVVDAAPPVVDAGPPVENPLTFKGEHWEFTLPSEGWKGFGEETPPGTVVLINPSLMNLVILEERVFPGTLDVLALNNLRSIRNSGATVLSAKQVDVNGHKFVLVEAVKDSNKVWIWMATTGTNAIGFSCGGSATAPTDLSVVCSGIANTLKIK